MTDAGKPAGLGLAENRAETRGNVVVAAAGRLTIGAPSLRHATNATAKTGRIRCNSLPAPSRTIAELDWRNHRAATWSSMPLSDLLCESDDQFA
jgi:hypothetical protein